jgi:hypothetical protein
MGSGLYVDGVSLRQMIRAYRSSSFETVARPTRRATATCPLAFDPGWINDRVYLSYLLTQGCLGARVTWATEHALKFF